MHTCTHARTRTRAHPRTHARKHARRARPARPLTHYASMVFRGSATSNSKPVAALTASRVTPGAISRSVGLAPSGACLLKSKTPMSVMHRSTTLSPVRGREQLCFSLCLSPLAKCSMTIKTLESEETRSMAPPMPLTIFPGMIQLARSPLAATSIAPRMVTSTFEPRIMAKESEDEKVEEPGIMVMVSLPALIKSAFTWSSVGYGPMPNRPFSLCNSMRTPGAR
mmetsp:Transcript_51318/g.159064  ORF Transcript_51318/g.159064 Transcript_51318/m.159064 type:complete len:224 (-) Transcript_51318:1037-1708(-)